MARTREFDEQKVIEIATELFWAKGYHAVSTQDLVDAFGISRSSMYGAYKDKKNIFVLALNHYRQTASMAMLKAMQGNQPFKQKISGILKAIIKETIGDDKCKGCFMVNTAIELAPHDQDILEIVQANRNDIIWAMKTAIQTGIDKGEISPDKNPSALAVYFYNVINGLRVDAKVHKTKAHYQETVDLALKALEN
jgi:TetR/AcrR family transcriptional regulator, transcriptional repressor for nem operon